MLKGSRLHGRVHIFYGHITGIMKSVKKVLRKVQDFGKSLKGVYVKCKKVVTEIGKQIVSFIVD